MHGLLVSREGWPVLEKQGVAWTRHWTPRRVMTQPGAPATNGPMNGGGVT